MDRVWSQALVDCDLFYIWAGRGKMKLRDRTVVLKAGVCIWMRPDGEYTAEHDPDNPLGVTYIHFVPHTSGGQPCLTDDVLPNEYHEISNPVFFSIVTEKIVHLHRRWLSDSSRQNHGSQFAAQQATALLESLILELQLPVVRSPMLHREAIEKQIASIYEHPGAVPTVLDLARELYLSKDHYTRVFRCIAGISPRELIQQARLNRACSLLKETSLSASEIAEQVGYSDLYQFSRIFKHRIGLAPTIWRRRTAVDAEEPQLGHNFEE